MKTVNDMNLREEKLKRLLEPWWNRYWKRFKNFLKEYQAIISFTMLGILSISVIMFVSMGDNLKSRRIINYIIEYGIDSVNNNGYYINNEYCITSFRDYPAEPFKSERIVDFCIVNEKGETVISDWDAWDSDEEKLADYIKEWNNKK